MTEHCAASERTPVRIGVVTYLNARPLTFCLAELAPSARIVVDLPSRLADGLARGRLDVALVPSIEYLRNPGYTIVSDSCISCDGPVKSVMFYSRVPVQQIRTLALDEGSRTSAAMTRILLKARFALEPRIECLPIGARIEDSTADAAMLVGDRGMLAPQETFEFVWDMGQQWRLWIGLPFVFAMWVARPGVDLEGMDEVFAAARDQGVNRLAEIARAEAPTVGLPPEQCLSYLRDNLSFRLGRRQRQGLETFYRLAGRYGLAPTREELVFYDRKFA